MILNDLVRQARRPPDRRRNRCEERQHAGQRRRRRFESFLPAWRKSCEAAGIGVLALLLAVGRGALPADAETYSFIDLGTLGGNYSQAIGISASGQVVGEAESLRGGHAFLYDTTGMYDLGTLGGGFSRAYGINTSGQVVGEACLADNGQPHAFLFDSVGMHDLGTLPGGTYSLAYGINTSGQVAGVSDHGGKSHAFLYSAGLMNDLGTLGGPNSFASGLNDAGQVAGYSEMPARKQPFPLHAFRYDSSGMHDLGTLPGGINSWAFGINAAGQVVGYANTSRDSGAHAFLYDSTGMHDLGTLSSVSSYSKAVGINAAGQIVGESTADTGYLHAFLWDKGSMQDLNTLIPAGSGWIITHANAINAAGQIAAIGAIDGGPVNGPQHALLLTLASLAPTAPPQAPGGLAVRQPSPFVFNQLDLTWTDNSNNEAGFEIQRKGRSNQWLKIAVTFPNATSFSDTGLDAYAHYSYRARAINPSGNSAWSDEVAGDTGVGAIASIGWNDRDFDAVPLGTSSSPQKLTITNAGTGPLTLNSITVEGANPEEFAISRRVATIAPGETDFFSLVFTPRALGSRSALLTIASNATNSVGEIRLTGSGSPALIPSISMSPSSLSFGDQLVGTTNGAQAVLLQNTGQTPVEIRHVSIEGANSGDFAITGDGATGLQLLPGRIVIVNVRFLPTAAGPRTASLTITDTAEGSPHLVPLSGTGLAAAVQLSSSSLTFGEQPVNSASGAQTVTITNSGTAPLTIPAVTLAGDNPGEFTIGTAASGVTLAPGESRTLEVRFAPTRPGSRSAILVISHNAPGSPHLVTLSGTGTAPSVTFGISRLERPTRLSFGDQPVGTPSAAQTLTVTNSGAAPLTISSVRITGANAADFALAADSGGPILVPGASRSFTLNFHPTGKGSRSASLTMSDNAVGSPHAVTLQGMGLLVPPAPPAGLEVKVVASKEIQLTWVVGIPETASYAIWRKVGGGEFQRCGGVSGMLNRFVDRHVSPNTQYTYRVRANGPGGVSAWSEEVGGTTPSVAPVAPTGLTVRALSASQIELRWTDNSSDETGFALWRKSGASAWARVGGVPTGTTRFVDRKLSPNTAYTYQVRANGPGGVSDWSNAASGTTLAGS